MITNHRTKHVTKQNNTSNEWCKHLFLRHSEIYNKDYMWWELFYMLFIRYKTSQLEKETPKEKYSYHYTLFHFHYSH